MLGTQPTSVLCSCSAGRCYADFQDPVVQTDTIKPSQEGKDTTIHSLSHFWPNGKGEALLMLSLDLNVADCPKHQSGSPILTNGNSINCPDTDKMNLVKLSLKLLLFFFKFKSLFW